MMVQEYFTPHQAQILELSSALENAAYLADGGESLAYVASGKSKSGTCNCASSKSSGGTCRSVSLDDSLIPK